MKSSLPPVALYQANIDLTRELVDACRQNGEDWLQLTQRMLSGSLSEPAREADALAHAPDPSAFAAVAATGACQQWDRACADVQTLMEMSMANQTAFAAAVGRAVGEWQRQVSAVVGAAVVDGSVAEAPPPRASRTASRKVDS
ncbi:phasin family protein [Verticiella sediminum]|nr:phasin family protein [Verticiella sediminum]